MADPLYLSLYLPGFTPMNMLRHYEKALRSFPFSRLTKTGHTVRVSGISFTEPPLYEQVFAPESSVDDLLAPVRDFAGSDTAVTIETFWDLWRLDREWSLAPARVSIVLFGPNFESREDGDLLVDFGQDTQFLPHDGEEGHRMVQSNIRSLLHVVAELERVLSPERRRLWTESGENFAERLARIVSESDGD